MDPSIRDDSRIFRYRMTTICSHSCATSTQPVVGGVGAEGSIVAVGQPLGKSARRKGRQGRFVAMARGAAGQLDGAALNSPLSAMELDRVRLSIERGRPYGEDKWVRRTVEDLGLMHTVRPEGRPRKAQQPTSDT